MSKPIKVELWSLILDMLHSGRKTLKSFEEKIILGLLRDIIFLSRFMISRLFLQLFLGVFSWVSWYLSTDQSQGLLFRHINKCKVVELSKRGMTRAKSVSSWDWKIEKYPLSLSYYHSTPQLTRTEMYWKPVIWSENGTHQWILLSRPNNILAWLKDSGVRVCLFDAM